MNSEARTVEVSKGFIMDRRTALNHNYTPSRYHKRKRANYLLKAIIEEQHDLGELGIQLEYLLRLRGAKLATDPMTSKRVH